MVEYFRGLDGRLRAAGFGGRLLIVTSNGGVLDAAAVAEAPIHSIGSGPAMAPVAGRHFAERDGGADTAIVADTGGTTYDCRLVRRGRIPWTRETWLGEPLLRPHDRLPVGRREVASARAAARSPGSTRAAYSTSDRRARAPSPGRPATAAAGRDRR